MTLLAVTDLGKSYRGYRNGLRRVGSWFGLNGPDRETWVLRGVSLSARAGETIGVIGHNGAGKSTLLKLITGTLAPTTGRVEIHGRIAAILELGMGFNPEMTGRENARHGLNLAGLSPAMIDELIHEVEAFAEVGMFFDQPLRTYSSGMQVRVAFAVATATRPDILIVDEALSVGDAYFQHKSFRRIREFQEQGTALLLVSHDSNSIQAVCDRAILIDQGEMIKDGPPEAVIDYYNALIARRSDEEIEERLDTAGKVQTVSGSRKAEIISVEICDATGRRVETVATGAEIVLTVKARAREPLERLILGFAIRDRLGQTIFGTNTWYTGQTLETIEAGQDIEYSVAFRCDLGPNTYSVAIALTSSETHLVDNYEWRNLAAIFEVVNLSESVFIGCVRMDVDITIEQSQSASTTAREVHAT